MKDNIVKHRWILLWGKKEVSLYYQNDIWSLCCWKVVSRKITSSCWCKYNE